VYGRGIRGATNRATELTGAGGQHTILSTSPVKHSARARPNILPLITVITPAFNADRFVAEAIRSVLSQTCADFDYLIIDDGSTDATATIAQEFARTDARVRVLSNRANSGLSEARNEGLKRAEGRYVAFLDADDIWEPTFLARTLEEIGRNADVGAVFTWSLNFGEDVRSVVDAPRGGDYDFSDLFQGICPPRNGSCLLIDRRCFSEVGGFLTTLRVGADAEMWLRMSSRCSASLKRFRCIPDVLARRRVTSNSMSADFFTEERLKSWSYRLETYLACLPREQQFDVLFVHFSAVARMGNHDASRWLDHWKRMARRTYRDELVRRSRAWHVLSFIPARFLLTMRDLVSLVSGRT
jgi:teichuronic acid biosynthesis glycosyltransferase TuaG